MTGTPFIRRVVSGFCPARRQSLDEGDGVRRERAGLVDAASPAGSGLQPYVPAGLAISPEPINFS